MGLAVVTSQRSDKNLSPGTLSRPSRRTMEAPEIDVPRQPVAGRGHSGIAAEPAARQSRVEVSPLETDWSQVVRSCMDGDSGAWAELVRTHHRRVYGLCYRLPATRPTPKT